jgi:hypothetical protein
MNADEKRKWIRDKLKESEQLTNTGIAHFDLTSSQGIYASFLDVKEDFPKIEDSFPVTERKNVLKLLEADGYIKIKSIDYKTCEVEMLPAHPSPIKLKVLELIARALGDKFTGYIIVNILMDYGISRCDIPYPGTKWRVLLDVFTELATSPNVEQRQKFWGVIPAFIHPLNFSFDETVSQKFVEDFNRYLKYDGYKIVAADNGDGYKIVSLLTAEISTHVSNTHSHNEATLETKSIQTERPKSIAEIEADAQEQVDYETKILLSTKGAEQMAILRKAYTTLMSIAEVFSADPSKPTRALDTNYVALSIVVQKILEDFTGNTSEFEIFGFDDFSKIHYGIPFSNLYSAEHDFKKVSRKVSWDDIRPEMNLVLGRIEVLCEAANAGDVIVDPKIQKIIGDTMLILSEIIAKRKGSHAAKIEPTVKMEITKMPELQVHNVEDSSIVKGKKRVHLPKFNETEWSKVTLHFTDEQGVVITADKKQAPSDYKALGFADDKRDRPNKAWGFLLALARSGGATLPLPKPIPDDYKQLKKQVSDRLKVIFKNDTDPFYAVGDTGVYRIKIALKPPHADATKPDRFGVQEYLKDTMTEEYEE